MILPTPSVNQAKDPDQAIAYSYDWLIQHDLEQGLSYENANYAQVEIIRITDDGISVIFADAEAEINANHQGWHRQYQYQYDDLDADGYKEIIKTGDECVYQVGDEGLEKTDCQKVKKVYTFNGTEYAEQG
jgi:hypothetical protein